MFIEFRKRFRRRIRRRTASAAALEFDLPEPIIQLIQSFLTSKEAARTTILSKPWRSAWLTRPNLDFDLADFCGSNYDCNKLDPKFLEFMEKTLERYENFNLKIDSFRLSMECRRGINATEFVCRALKLGPTHLTLEFDGYNYNFDIPDDVFTRDNLLSLTAKGCTIYLMNRDELCCSRLRFLSLEYVTMKSRDMNFTMFMKSCPLIEKLSLCNVRYDVGHSGTLDLLQINLHRLTSLVLTDDILDTRLLANLSLIFPSLKDLTLSSIFCEDEEDEEHEEMLISSPTLERLDLGRHTHRVKLDIPSIRKFTFSCSSIPKLSVRSNSRGWESHISVSRRKCLSASWFKRLSNFLNKLRFSRITLSLHVSSRATFDYEPGDITGLPLPEIENLYIYHEHLPTQSCYVLFDGLFRMCRPKVIAPYMSDSDSDSSYGLCQTNNIDFLGKRLLEARDEKVPIPNYQFMYGLNDLKEARAQVFDWDFNEWQDVTLESLLDEYLTIDNAEDSDDDEVVYYPLHRFQLNWKS